MHGPPITVILCVCIATTTTILYTLVIHDKLVIRSDVLHMDTQSYSIILINSEIICSTGMLGTIHTYDNTC